jgi:O-methyltransferase
VEPDNYRLNEEEKKFLELYYSGTGLSKVEAARLAGYPSIREADLAQFAEVALEKQKILVGICKDLSEGYFLKYLSIEERLIFLNTPDPVRYGAIKLAIDRIIKDNISGAFAEVGVYQGHTSKIIHTLAPHKVFYLFDTFEGFPKKDLGGREDNRFQDTGLDVVKKIIGNLDNIKFREGYFPETAKGLENEVFAFVMLDVDLYPPTLSGLEFFYPRLSPGGYLFIHDYSDGWEVYRAVNDFMRDKKEGIVCLPDIWGSAVICKSRIRNAKVVFKHFISKVEKYAGRFKINRLLRAIFSKN